MFDYRKLARSGLPALFFAIILLSDAQQSPLTTPTFTSRTNLVLIPTIVDDGDKHVSGLSKDNFEIFEDGKRKDVVSFEPVTTTSNIVGRVRTQPGVYSNAITADSAPKRLTIFALDTVNTPFLDQQYAREELIKFLARRMDSKEPCALVSIQSDGIRVIHEATSDPAVLVAALEKVSSRIPNFNPSGSNVAPMASEALPGEESSLENFLSGTDLRFARFAQATMIRVTLDAFQHVAAAFAGVPGRKSLVWATASFPFGLDPSTGALLAPTVFSEGAAVQGNAMDATGGLPKLPDSTTIHASSDLRVLIPEYERTIQALNDANISLYPVDARGLVTFFADASTSRISGIHSLNSALFESSRETMEGFATMTGGRAFYNRNDLDRAFGRAADDSNSYYMLGYHLDKNAKPGWHKLQVKLNNTRGHIRARNGFFVTAENHRSDIQKLDISLALSSPLDATGLPLYVRWLGTSATPKKRKVSFELDLPPNANLVDESDNNHLSLEMVAAAFTANGDNADRFAEHIEGNLKPVQIANINRDGINYNNNIQVPPGEYRVRFVVRDNLSGRVGSVSVPLTVLP